MKKRMMICEHQQPCLLISCIKYIQREHCDDVIQQL